MVSLVQIIADPKLATIIETGFGPYQFVLVV